jgi:hypothetical protein
MFLIAQDDTAANGWQRSGVGTLTFTQNSFDNWSGGGEDSWAWLMNVDASMNRTEEGYTWSNNLKLSFGQSSVGGEDARKSADELKFESVYTKIMGEFINPYAAFTLRTQMTDGYFYDENGDEVQTSGLMDPGYLTESIGVGYKPNDNIQTRLGAAAKHTVGSEDYLYADDPDTDDEVETFKSEFGIESVTDVNFTVAENILFTSKLEAFSNFASFDEIDVNWDNMFTAKVNELINVSLNVKIYYDYDISAKRQLSQTLGVGVSYTLF